MFNWYKIAKKNDLLKKVLWENFFSRNPAKVKWSLDNVLPFYTPNRRGETRFHVAIQFQEIDIIKLLLAQKPGPLGLAKAYDYALTLGNLSVINLLEQNGAKTYEEVIQEIKERIK